MKNEISVFWFRRDLRLEDNTGLFHALNNPNPVLPIFIFDTVILLSLKKDDARVSFIYEQLRRLREELRCQGSSLAVYHGTPADIFRKLKTQYILRDVFSNRDYEPYARIR